MSGGVEGVDIGATLAAADYLISLYERLWKGGAVRDLAEAIGTYERLKLSVLTTPPARSYADGVRDSAKVADDYALGALEGGEPLIEATAEAIAAAIRLLSQGGKA